MREPLPENKEIWASHCEQHYVPLYFRSWWMDSVCGATNWGVCLSLDGGGKVEGALVYYIKRRFGLAIITMPPLTAYSGLWLHHPTDLVRPSSRMAFEKRVCKKLLEQLPAYALFYQQWHPAITNWLPYFWKGFRQTTLYTYYISNIKEKEKIFKEFDSSTRNHILNATQNLNISLIDKPSELFDVYSMSLKRQKMEPPFSLNFFLSLDEKLKHQNSRAILCATDGEGNIHGAIYLIWDECYTYFSISGINTNFRHSGSMNLLLYKAMEWNFGNTIIFDFEGAMLEHVERFFRSFGTKLVPHFKIAKTSNRLLQVMSLLMNKSFY